MQAARTRMPPERQTHRADYETPAGDAGARGNPRAEERAARATRTKDLRRPPAAPSQPTAQEPAVTGEPPTRTTSTKGPAEGLPGGRAQACVSPATSSSAAR